jgi:hypothetical protein
MIIVMIILAVVVVLTSVGNSTSGDVNRRKEKSDNAVVFQPNVHKVSHVGVDICRCWHVSMLAVVVVLMMTSVGNIKYEMLFKWY